MTWEEYFAQLDELKQKTLVKILDIALKYSPSATKEMPYGVPGLKLDNKPLIAVAAHNNHYGIYPFSSKVIATVKDQLAGLETAQGTIRFHYDMSPKENLIEDLIKLRSAEIKKD